MNKINFQNLPDTSTPLNASNMNQIQTNVETEITRLDSAIEQSKIPQIITATINRKSFTISTSWGAVNLAPFDSYVSTTNKITLQNNGLKIGTGVSKILVSASMKASDNSSFPGDKIFQIAKNDVDVVENYLTNQGSWAPQTISPMMIEVQENDIITLKFASGGTGTGDLLGEYLTIQVVE